MSGWFSPTTLPESIPSDEAYGVPDADKIRRYKHLRQVGLELNNAIVRATDPESFKEAAKAFGLLHGNVITLDTEDQISLVTDYCLHDIRRHGKNPLEVFLERTPPPADSDEMQILKASIESTYTILGIEGAEAGRGCYVLDFFNLRRYFLTDVNLSRGSPEGALLATRVKTIDGMTMTTGAALPIPVESKKDLMELIDSIRAKDTKPGSQQTDVEYQAQRTLKIIRYCLKMRASERIRYEDPHSSSTYRHRTEREPSVQPIANPALRVGRNDACPCGSGKKSKKCCNR